MIARLEAHRNIIDFALSSLARRKGKNLSLLAMYVLIVFLTAVIVFSTAALKREARLILDGAPDIVVQRMIAGRNDPVPAGYGPRLAAIAGVQEVRPRLWGYYYDPVFGANYTVMAAEAAAPQPGAVVIGSGVARTAKVAAGDIMTLRGASGAVAILEVERVLPYASELVAADLIVATADDFRSLFAFPAGVATDFAVSVANPAERKTVAAKIARDFPDTRPILKSEMLATYDAIFDWRGGVLVAMLTLAVFSFGIFAWDKATGLSAEERREIGILKSIGWETSDVLLLKFYEGIVVSLTAFLAGSILAYVQVFFFGDRLFGRILKGWSVLYPRFNPVPAVDMGQVAVLFFLTVLPYAVATVLPSWRAATVDPDAAMRS